MRIGIIGPSRIKNFCAAIDKDEFEYLHFLEVISEHLASTNHEIVIVPTQNCAAGIIARSYKDYRGKKVLGLSPRDDKEFGILDIDETIPDEIINCGTWRNQPETLVELSDILLVVGLSTGGMIEICYTKWFGKKRVLLLTDFMSEKLHPEIEKDIKFEYINIDELSERIR